MKYGTVLKLKPIGPATAAAPIRVMFLRHLTRRESVVLMRDGTYFKGILVNGDSRFEPGGIYDFGTDVYVPVED